MTEVNALQETEQPVKNSEALLVVDTKNYFKELANIDVSEQIEKKNGFSYLSWAFATALLKEKHPSAKILVKRFPETDENGNMKNVPYLKTDLGYFVEVEVIVDGVSVSEPFPVTDYRNKPIPKPTTFDINSSIQRAKVKSIAGHGLGLYIYAGEDLPIEVDDTQKGAKNNNQKARSKPAPLMSDGSKKEMKNLVFQLVNLTVGEGTDDEVKKSKMKEIFDHYKIVANTTEQRGQEVIATLKKGIETKIKKIEAEKAQQPVTPNGEPTFVPPTDDLDNLI